MASVLTGQVGPQTYADNATPGQGIRMGNHGELLIGQLHGRFYEQVNRRNMFFAQAIVTAPVIYTTAAGTGGPLLWNGSTTHKAVIHAISWGISTVSTAGAALGLTGGVGQSVAPTTTTAIDSVKNCYLGGDTPVCTAYRIGTPAAAGGFLFPLGQLHTGALTVSVGAVNWIDIGGAFVVPPTGWISVAASATASTTVMTVGMLFEEIPV